MQIATAKPLPIRSRPRRRRILLLAVAALAGLAIWLWQPVTRHADAAAAFGARVACPCRFIAQRALSDCRRDFEPGMAMVMLSEDRESRSVTARVPLLAAQTATYREGQGCRLERWRD